MFCTDMLGLQAVLTFESTANTADKSLLHYKTSGL